MAAYPYAEKPAGNKVSIHVPRDWFVTVSAVSLDFCTIHSPLSYTHLQIATNIRRGTSAMFYSDASSLGPMEDAVFSRTSFPINARTKEIEYLLDITAFYSETGSVGAGDLRKSPQYNSNQVDVHEVGQLMGMPSLVH
jgi:hypothetical protein